VSNAFQRYRCWKLLARANLAAKLWTKPLDARKTANAAGKLLKKEGRRRLRGRVSVRTQFYAMGSIVEPVVMHIQKIRRIPL
jgi:hypothetical protein